MIATPQIDCRDVRLNSRIFDGGIIGGLAASRYAIAAVDSNINVAYVIRIVLLVVLGLQDEGERET